MELKEKKDATSKSLKTKTKPSLIQIGKIQKAHGIKGEVLLRLSSGENLKPFPKILYGCKDSFNEIKETQEADSYEVLKVRFVPQGVLLQFKDCTDRNEALKLQGLSFYVDSKELKSPENSSLFLSELLGFRVCLQEPNSKSIGIISHFISHSHQDLMVVSQKGKSIEIPFVRSYIKDIDFKNKNLFLTLPENFLNTF